MKRKRWVQKKEDLMELERAKEIVSAINSRCYYSMGLKYEMGDIDNVSLADMLEAKAAVERLNLMIPDDRLIAAVYVLENYRPSGESVASKPFSKETDICVGVVETEREQTS